MQFPRNDEAHIFRRIDNILFEGDIVERKIDNDPDSESYLQFEFDSVQTGTLYINGNNAETITFTNTQYMESAELYTSVAGITPSSLTGIVKIKAVTKQGAHVKPLKTIRTLKVNYSSKTTSQFFRLAGMESNFAGTLFALYDADIQIGDIVKINDLNAVQQFEVKQIAEPKLFGKVQHKEVILINNEA